MIEHSTGTDLKRAMEKLRADRVELDKLQNWPPLPDGILTWEKVCEAEPRLLDLLWEVRLFGRDGDAVRVEHCSNWAWTGRHGFRRRMAELVGFNAAHPQLRTKEAYDLAYVTLWDALPVCDCEECV